MLSSSPNLIFLTTYSRIRLLATQLPVCVVSMSYHFHPTVVQLLRPHNDADELQQYAIKMKEIRLKALASDPGSFSSSLAMEIDQPLTFWTTRLTHPEARYFVAYLPKADGAMEDRAEHPLKSRFIATLVLLGPQTIDLNTFMDDMSRSISLMVHRNPFNSH